MSAVAELQTSLVLLERAIRKALPWVPDPPPLAWRPCPGWGSLKLCPLCHTTALEGEVDCTNCGCEPDDDSTWRDQR